MPEGDCEHTISMLHYVCIFHKSYNSPQVVQRVVDKVLLGVDYGVVSGVVHGVKVRVFSTLLLEGNLPFIHADLC